MEKIEKLLQSKYGSTVLIVIGVLGMLLIGFGSKEKTAENSIPTDRNKADNSITYTADAYAAQTEQKLEALLGAMEGAGETHVMVTLSETSRENYAVDIQQSGTGSYEEKHVLLGNGTALTESCYAPCISGVAVVCEGGGSIAVVARMTELLAALLDLPTNRISIQKSV